MKLNEFKKRKQVNEIDSRSLFGDYGSAALRTSLGSMAGKNVLSTTDQMAKDDFITKFTSRALSGLQSAINGGLVDPNAAGQGAQTTGQTTPQTTQTTQQGQQPSATDAIAQKRIAAQKAQAAAIREPGADEGPKYNIDPNKQMSPYSKLPATTPKTPEQIRQEKLAAASQAAQGQMNPMNKLPADQFAKSASNVRKQKQGVATQNAQGQMNPVSKLPADQFAKSASNVRQTQQGQAATAAQGQMTPKVAGPTPKTPEQIRQAKQLAATQAAQGQMNPASKLPADQFAKSADNVRQQQQTTATQTAQQQMATPKQVDPRYPNGKYDGVTGQPTPEYQKELDKSAAASAEKQKADAAASQAQAKSNDDMAANMNNIAAQRNIPDVPQASTPKVSTGADAEQAALDKMKQKNPKLAGMMAQAGLDDNLDDIKPDNTVQMPKRNKKPKGKAAESTRFDKLNYIFETILAEQDPESIATKQTISQYISTFFTQFMKGINITDPTVIAQIKTLAKELEQTYAKDKGRTTLPKLANLAYSVSYANATNDDETKKTTPSAEKSTSATSTTPSTTTTPAATKQAKITSTTITQMMKDFSPGQKKIVLQALQKELNDDLAKKQTTTPAEKEPTVSVGKQKRSAKAVDPADAQLLATAKKQGKI